MPRDIQIGNAVLGLRADIKQYLTAMGRAAQATKRKREAIRRLQYRMRQAQYRINRFSSSLISLRSAVGVLVGTGGLGLLIKQSAELGTTIFETSVRTGLAVERLQTLGRVFEGDGVSVQQFNKFLTTLNKNIGAGQAGLQSYVDAFGLLGIDVNRISNLADAVDKISDALASGEVTRTSAIYALQTLGGRAGAQAFNVLAQGSKVLRDQEEQFHRLGILTTEQSAKLKILAQSQTDLSNAVKTNAARVVADLSGLIHEALNEAIERVPAAFERIQQIIEYTVQNVRNLADAFILLGVAILRNTFIGRFVGSLTSAVKATFNLRLAVASVIRTFAGFHEGPVPAVIRTSREFERLKEVVTGVGKRIDTFLTTWETRAANTYQKVRTGAIFTWSSIQRGAVRTGFIVGRSIAAGVTVAINAFRTLATAVISVARLIGRIVWPFAIIEGILLSVKFLKILKEEADTLGVSFRDAAVIASTELVGTLVQGLAFLTQRVVAFYHGVVSGAYSAFEQFRLRVEIPFAKVDLYIAQLGERIDQFFANLGAKLGSFFGRSDDSLRININPEVELTRVERINAEIEHMEDQLVSLGQVSRKAFDDAGRAYEDFLLDTSHIPGQVGGATTDALRSGLQSLLGFEPETLEASRRAATNTIDRMRNEIRDRLKLLSGDFSSSELELPEIDTSGLQSQFDDIQNSFQDIGEVATEVADDIKEANDRTARSIAEAFGNAAAQVVVDFSNLTNTVRNLINSIVNSLAQRFIAQPITNAFSGLLGGLFGTAQTGGLHSGLTLVGEAGPELVDFRNPARVYTNNQLRDTISQGASTPNVTVPITINSADAGAVERSIADSIPVIIDAVKGAIARDVSHPSVLNSQLRGY